MALRCLTHRLLIGTICLLPLLTSPRKAHAESGSSARLVIFPFLGPGGAVARNAVYNRVAPNVAFARKVGGAQAKAPARTARALKANALVTGAVRCPGRSCVVEVVITKRSGRVWAKSRVQTPRSKISAGAAELTARLLNKIGLMGPPRQARDEEVIFGSDEENDPYAATPSKTTTEPQHDDDQPTYTAPVYEPDDADDDEDDEDEEEDEYDEDDEDDEDSDGHDFDAIEFYFNTDLTIRRDICVDLDMDNFTGDGCDRKNPYWDDRAYSAGPFASLGTRITIFPGAFVNRRRPYSHLGIYFEYSRSVGLSSRRTFESPDESPSGQDPEQFQITVDTVQQDFKVGLVYRIPVPFRSPNGPQFRLMVGAGYYEFSFDDNDWPDDEFVATHFRDSNPYLPSFSYLSLDSGLELRIPIRGFVFPYFSVLYRATFDAGQANRIYGNNSTIHGVNGEIGVRLEPGAGVRFILAADLVWYLSTFDGSFLPEDEEEQDIWNTDAFPGNRATDFIIRLRFGIGWSY